MSQCPKCGYEYPEGCDASCDYKHPISEWIDVLVRKPTPADSPILAIESLEHFSIKALEYTDGWDGDGWYDTSQEYGMGLNEGEAHYHEYGGMKYWMPLPQPPVDRKKRATQ